MAWTFFPVRHFLAILHHAEEKTWHDFGCYLLGDLTAAQDKQIYAFFACSFPAVKEEQLHFLFFLVLFSQIVESIVA